MQFAAIIYKYQLANIVFAHLYQIGVCIKILAKYLNNMRGHKSVVFSVGWLSSGQYIR